MGEKATSSILNDRACPQGMSPKRPIPMDIDQAPSPIGKKKKKMNKKRQTTTTPTQRRLTDIWKVDPAVESDVVDIDENLE